ncbi:hypothetical protein JST97_19635 [bacterium]|nr:hypothetical protein [bacterium]
MRPRRRGGSLLGVMLLVAALTVGALAVASLATWGLQLSSRQENQQIALEMADSALHQGLAQLMLHPEWGQDRLPSISISGVVGMPEGSRAELTFASSAGTPYSTNNLAGNQPSGWNGTAVPANRTHLVARGWCRGLERRVEMMVYRPRFPRAVACDGPVELHGSLVAAVKDLHQVVDASGNVNLDENNLSSGDVLSNDQQFLREQSRVKGSAQAKVAVVTEDQSVVEGEVLAPAEPANIPHFRLADFDPQGDPDTLFVQRPAGSFSGLNMTGITRFQSGGVTVNGDLSLDNAVVYVDGNLRVTGSLQGVGGVIVNGQTEVGGAVRLTSSDNVALLSQGDIRLRGDGQESSFFQGLLLTQGALSADRLTIVGSAIATQRIWISRCRMVYSEPAQLAPIFRKVVLAIDRSGTLAAAQSPLDTSKGYPVSVIRGKHVSDALSGGYSWSKPGVLTVEKVDGRFRYTYQQIHHSLGLQTYGPDEDRARFVSTVRDMIASEWRYHAGPLAGGFSGVLTHTEQGLNHSLDEALATRIAPDDQVVQGNFDLSPNRFLSEAEQLRVLYRREL